MVDVSKVNHLTTTDIQSHECPLRLVTDCQTSQFFKFDFQTLRRQNYSGADRQESEFLGSG